MKKTNIITITVLALSFVGSIAHAGNFSNLQGIAIPGLDQAVHVAPAVQCEIAEGMVVDLQRTVTYLQNQVEGDRNGIIELKNKVEYLDGKLQEIRGTSENECAHQRGLTGQAYRDCVSDLDAAAAEIENAARSVQQKVSGVTSQIARWN